MEIEDKGATVTVDQLPIVRGHRRQLQQLFQNLVGNALKYSRPGVAPEVRIHSRQIAGDDTAIPASRRQGGGVYHLVTVQDNGIGFDQADADRIFNVFTRLHGLTEYKGTGVGLSIVRKVVENHGGQIWAQSELGKGATFYLLLPAGTA
jgi:signal transduction histidine kinase